MRKLVACLACRNKGTRLFGKPLQNLDIEKSITILDYMIDAVKTYEPVSGIVLAISEGVENKIFEEVAKKHNIDWVYGDEEDVLGRVIKACNKLGGTDIFRLTTESPFTYFEAIDKAWEIHNIESNDMTALDNLPDGSGFEIINIDSYVKSWNEGQNKHRSEFCSLFIRENKSKFKIKYVEVPSYIRRLDIRLTVDYPEDLILCRELYKNLSIYHPRIPLIKIIDYLDKNIHLKKLVSKYVDDGLKTMYL